MVLNISVIELLPFCHSFILIINFGIPTTLSLQLSLIHILFVKPDESMILPSHR